MKVYLGGGRKQFIPTPKKNSVRGGLRNDGRNLIDEWVADRNNVGKALYVDNRVSGSESPYSK